MTIRFLGTLAAATLLFVAGCDRSPSATERPGELRFTYTGARNGSFEAAGRLNPSDLGGGSWAVAYLEPGAPSTSLTVVAQRVGGGTRDNFVLGVAEVALGTHACITVNDDCPIDASFVSGLTPDGEAEVEFYSSSTGSVTVTRFDDLRVAGSFVFELEDDGDPGHLRTLRVTGSFDVPLLAEFPVHLDARAR